MMLSHVLDCNQETRYSCAFDNLLHPLVLHWLSAYLHCLGPIGLTILTVANVALARVHPVLTTATDCLCN